MNQEQFSNFFSLFGLPGRPINIDVLFALGAQMHFPKPTRTRSGIPSAYVYFGQFLVHDMSRLADGDRLPGSHQVSIDGLKQIRNPSLELDSLYGNPYKESNIPCENGKMVLGYAFDKDDQKIPDTDLPRDKALHALIGDDRNDENLIVAQLHLQFLKLHNHFFDRLRADNTRISDWELYNQAREQVILHYQSVVLYDFLYRLLDRDVWEHVIHQNKGTLWTPVPAEQPRVPVEFSAAAMRFGHSMILPSYNINGGSSLGIKDLFSMTGRRGFNGARGLGEAGIIDWRLFLDFSDLGEAPDMALPPNHARRIDTDISLEISGEGEFHHYNSIAVRNLLRGNQLNLPGAQDIVMYLQENFSELCASIKLDEVYLANIQGKLSSLDMDQISEYMPDMQLDKVTPLWYYILAEAKIQNEGLRLGTLGSLIIAEVIRALVDISRISIYRHKDRLRNLVNPTLNYDEKNGESKKLLQLADLINAVNHYY